MKKVLIITSGFLPLPAVDGGAVANLTENYIKYNEEHPTFKFVSYSIPPKSVDYKEIKNLNYSEFRFIKNNKFLTLVFRIISKLSYHILPNYFIYSIKRDIKKRKEYFDYILVENNPLLVRYLKKTKNQKIILHVHNDWLNKNTEHRKKIVSNCDKIITVSNFVKNRVAEINPNSNIKVVINGIDTNRFKKIENQKINASTRKKYNILEEDLVFLFTGKLKPEKGALEVITAFTQINENHKNIKLLMVGSSFNKNDKDTQYIIDIKNKVKNNKNIIFTGFVDYNEIHQLYSISDIQIVPSLIEDSCPLVVIEGMSSGLALITTISGGIPELVNDKCAFLLEKKDNLVSEMSQKMKFLIENPKILEKMKKESLKRSQTFTNDTFCQKMLDEINFTD